MRANGNLGAEKFDMIPNSFIKLIHLFAIQFQWLLGEYRVRLNGVMMESVACLN